MLARVRALLPRRNWLILAAALMTILLLLIYGWVADRPGLWYWDQFLKETAPDTWSGQVDGETLTITRREDALLLEHGSRTRTFAMTGTLDDLTLYEDGKEVFRGRYSSPGILLDENGELVFESHYVTYTVNGVEYTTDENGNPVSRSPLDMGLFTAIDLLVHGSDDTRGAGVFAWFAALLLAFVFAELWCPALFFRWQVGRYANSEVEPSDWYYFTRAVAMIALTISAIVILVLGLRH